MSSGLLRIAGWSAAGLAVVGGMLALVNRALLLDDLPPTLPGAMHDWTWRGWRVRYTMLGDGPPLVLVHGLHAAASSFEMRGIFEPLSRRYTVYALDLLGFGKSERPAAPYSGQLYADLLRDFLAEVVVQPAVVMASSLSSAYAVAVACSRPSLINRLILISPTDTTSTRALGRLLGAVLAVPLLGSAAFNLLVAEVSIRHYLSEVYADPGFVDETLVGQEWATAHQPNARLAPAAFVAGRLDLPLSADATPTNAPMLVVRGSAPGLGTVMSDTRLQHLSSDVTIRTLDGVGQLPHDEAPDELVTMIEAWLTHAGA